MELHDYLKQIEIKVNALGNEVVALRKENLSLKSQIESLKMENLAQKNQVEHSEENNNFINIAKRNLSNATSNEALIHQIDALIEEVNRSIDMLND